MLAARADVTGSGAGDAPRPGALWAEVSPGLHWAGAVAGAANATEFEFEGSQCPAALANGMAPTFDWSKDFSRAWGSEFARNWSWSLSAYKAASSIRPRAAPNATRAAAVVLDRTARLAAAAKTSPAANFQQMAFPRAAAAKGPNGGGGYKGRGGNCGCETSCGWGELNTYNYVVRRLEVLCV